MNVPVAMKDPLLLPQPQRMRLTGDGYSPTVQGFIGLRGAAQELLPAGKAIQDALRQYAGFDWGIVAGAGEAIQIVIEPEGLVPQGYRLTIDRRRVRIAAADPAGAYYSAQTVVQLLRQDASSLPGLEIEDWPDFPARGVMLDISRDKVPTMETLYALIDQLAEWKINELQLYTEHTFAYREHPEVWAEASPMTGEEILALVAYCRARFVELVPNQNSFGHMERWLKHPRYRPLAESPDGFVMPDGDTYRDPFSLCPLDPRSLELIEGLYDELLPHFSSRLFNVGCDETFDLGQGRSKEACERQGTERVYLDFLLKIYQMAKSRDRTMQFWGDIILHKPELIPEIPKDCIALEWGYEADHPFAKDGALFRDAGVPFYVCPGTSSWNTIAGRTNNALGCLENAAVNGKKYGAIGFLMTDWGDNGHLQYLPISYLGFAAGASRSWNVAAPLPIREALSLHAFRDRADVMGTLAFDLGNVYQACGKLIHNNSALFHLLVFPDRPATMDRITLQSLSSSLKAIEGAMQHLDSARMEHPDSALIIDEFRNAASMLRLACRIGRLNLDATSESRDALITELQRILGEHRRLWLARNRPGGLHDSAARLERVLAWLRQTPR